MRSRLFAAALIGSVLGAVLDAPVHAGAVDPALAVALATIVVGPGCALLWLGRRRRA